jgi:hypothetical protein
VTRCLKSCWIDKWHDAEKSSVCKRRNNRIRAAGGVLVELTLMPKLVNCLERRYRCNESLRENCDYQIMSWS